MKTFNYLIGEQQQQKLWPQAPPIRLVCYGKNIGKNNMASAFVYKIYENKKYKKMFVLYTSVLKEKQVVM